jgi:hypothetical protein
VVVAGGWFGGQDFNSTEYLDLEAEKGGEMKWTVIESTMKEKRAGLSGVLLNDGVTFLVTGGNCGKSTFASCEQLDTTTMEWSDAPAMATARRQHCTVLYKKRAVVIGGQSIPLCEEYDPTSNVWSSFPPLCQTRYEHGACVLDCQIYVCGGKVNGSCSDSIEVFDGVKWSSFHLSLLSARSGLACVGWEGKLVALGGSQEEIEVYDEMESKWKVDLIPKPLIPERMKICAVSFSM